MATPASTAATGAPPHVMIFRMRLASVHPGVSVDDVVAATGFELVIGDDVPTTRLPTDEELTVLRDVLDPKSFRDRELPAPA